MTASEYKAKRDEILSNLEGAMVQAVNQYGHHHWNIREHGLKDAAQALDALVLEVVESEYSADYTKLGKCDVCGDYEFSHAPDEHKEAGVKEFRASIRAIITGGEG